MRRAPLIVALGLVPPALLLLVGCGGSSDTTASAPESSPIAVTTSAAPEPSVATSSPTPAPSPEGPLFVDVVDQALAPYLELIGTAGESADLASALPMFDGDVPLPAGNIVGAARMVDVWGDTLETTQAIGIDVAPSKAELEEYGAAAPEGWAYNSITTTDSSSSLVMTRDSDGLRIVYMSSKDPDPGEPPAEFRLEAEASEMPQPAWLAALPVPEGGEVIAVGEGIGQVEVDYFPALNGLVTATWRFPADELQALQEFYAGGALDPAGFALVDPDAISVGASYFDVAAGEWTGQVIVGEVIEEAESYATVQWFLQRP